MKSPQEFNMHLFMGLLLRMVMIVYGMYQDASSHVKYTDIDYHVVTDAAKELMSGESPYNRHTYRYTPLLSIMMLPNILFNYQFGKLLFSCLDCLVAKLIYRIMCADGHSKNAAEYASFLWLYNPVVIAISTRGSSESIVAILVMSFIYYAKLRLSAICGFFLGIAVHFKLYPIIFTLPLYLSYTKNYKNSSLTAKISPNIAKTRFLCALIVGFVIPSFLFYATYGETYLEESFFYHFSRRDTRHNFSIYFYILYLCVDCDSLITTILTVVPQCILIAAVGFRYGSNSDLSFGLFLQTFLFVTFNKVITSQYFVWYLVILPLITPRLNLSSKKCLFLFCLWIFAQGSWLLPAYLLEFHGVDAFLPLWLESIAFFCSNIGIAISLITAYDSKNSFGNETFLRKIK